MFFIFTIYTLWLLYKWHSLTLSKPRSLLGLHLRKGLKHHRKSRSRMV